MSISLNRVVSHTWAAVNIVVVTWYNKCVRSDNQTQYQSFKISRKIRSKVHCKARL